MACFGDGRCAVIRDSECMHCQLTNQTFKLLLLSEVQNMESS